MKNLLTAVFIVTTLYACGGEFQLQDDVSAIQAPPIEQGAMEPEAIEKKEANNKQAGETTNQTAADTKTDSAIEMVMGVAKSMF